ncbi:hypothetical protein [Streptomyces brevispora]|uniref:hypothetical protein n=1 Tax=Streptomyces brevispora TaxID=887462 RepID=UPI003824F56F
MTQTHEYTLLGRQDWAGDLRVEHVGVNWPEDKIQQEVDALDANGWCDTFQAESVAQAFRAAGEQYCDETHLDSASTLYDDRGPKSKAMYEGRTLQEQSAA